MFLVTAHNNRSSVSFGFSLAAMALAKCEDLEDSGFSVVVIDDEGRAISREDLLAYARHEPMTDERMALSNLTT